MEIPFHSPKMDYLRKLQKANHFNIFSKKRRLVPFLLFITRNYDAADRWKGGPLLNS